MNMKWFICTLNFRNSTNSRFRQDVVVMDKGCVLRFLENILVLVEFEQTFFRGTVELRVISPQGTRIMFLNERPQDTRRDPGQSTSSWIFKVVSFWGERAKGRWRLQYRSINPRVEGSNKLNLSRFCLGLDTEIIKCGFKRNGSTLLFIHLNHNLCLKGSIKLYWWKFINTIST